MDVCDMYNVVYVIICECDGLWFPNACRYYDIICTCTCEYVAQMSNIHVENSQKTQVIDDFLPDKSIRELHRAAYSCLSNMCKTLEFITLSMNPLLTNLRIQIVLF